MSTGLHVPVEIWKLVLKHISLWDVNVLLYIKLAHISRTARQVFLSDTAWRYMNPYGIRNDIFAEFWSHVQSLEPEDQQSMRIVWEAARKALVPRGSNELYYMVLMGKLPALESSNSLFYDLGFLLGTAYSYSRKDTRIRNLARNKQVIWCAINICPVCVDHVDHKMLGKKTALQAATSLLAMSRLFDTTIKSVETGSNESSVVMDIQLSSVISTPQAIKKAISCIDERLLPVGLPDLSKILTSSETNPGEYHLPTLWGFDLLYRLRGMNLTIELPLEVLRVREFCLPMFESASLSIDKEYYMSHPDIKSKIVEAVGNLWPADMCDDTLLVTKLVQWSGIGLQIASQRLKSDKNIVAKACKENGMAIRSIGTDIIVDKLMALDAVSSNGLALKFLPLIFRADYDVASRAVKSNGLALEFVADELKMEVSVCRSAVAMSGMAAQYVPESIINDPLIIQNALLSNGLSLQFLAPEVRGCKEHVSKAVLLNGLALEFAGNELKNDSQIAFLAVSSCGTALKYCSAGLRANAAIVRKAILDDPHAIYYASEGLSNDSTFLEMAKVTNASTKRGRSLNIIVI